MGERRQNILLVFALFMVIKDANATLLEFQQVVIHGQNVKMMLMGVFILAGG